MTLIREENTEEYSLLMSVITNQLLSNFHSSLAAIDSLEPMLSVPLRQHGHSLILTIASNFVCNQIAMQTAGVEKEMDGVFADFKESMDVWRESFKTKGKEMKETSPNLN